MTVRRNRRRNDGRPLAHRHLTIAFVAALSAGALTACGGGDGDASGVEDAATFTVPTTLRGAAAVTTPPQGTCISRAPGQPLDEAEAEVRFSTSGVCPSYVTVTGGTTVRWTNDHSAPVKVTMTEAPPAVPPSSGEVFPSPDSGAVVFTESVDAGATFEREMASSGTYYFRLDLIPTFLGTVEVR